MFNPGFGGGTGDFEGLSRQYWSAWGEAMRQAGVSAGVIPPPRSRWQQAVDWWSQLLPGGPSQANDAVERFNQQARDWYGQMQQVAAQFAGQDSSPADITRAWRDAIGASALAGSGSNPFVDMFKRMRGPGAHGIEEWLEQVQPYLEGMQQQSQRWQHMPAFGQYREHQERWQALQLALQEYQRCNNDHNQLMAHCMQQAFEVFEAKLASHEEPGRQIASARALFDLWIDAAEEAYAQVALSEEFRHATGALTNAQMHLRAAIQLEVEHMTGLFGMPTRTEIDSAHRKIADLERALRRANATSRPSRPVTRRTPQAAEPPLRREPSAAAVKTPVPARKPGKAATRKPVVRKAAAGSEAARKPARKPRARKKTAPGRAANSKLLARPAQVKAAVGKKKPAAAKPAATKSIRSTPAAGRAAKPAAVKPAPKPRQKPPAVAAAPGSARVVSMKDWVARYAAGNTPVAPDAAKQKKGKKGARK
jgi:class III poly(R)-hydroxyalkanoic acid synthase PhaE subunit